MIQLLKTLLLVFLSLGFTQLLLAQAISPSKDVCCYGYSESEAEITTFTAPLSVSICKSGSKDSSGRNICGSTNNLDDCAYMKTETVCTSCGLHWLKDLGKCSKKSLEDLVPKKEETKPEAGKKK